MVDNEPLRRLLLIVFKLVLTMLASLANTLTADKCTFCAHRLEDGLLPAYCRNLCRWRACHWRP
ncbi:hypothetical protein [Vibrio breoganii]|uniref:hypothetical protein n=1 Tax=Vibrio breoganii TaxID=553239 RepID=UPI0039AFAA54